MISKEKQRTFRLRKIRIFQLFPVMKNLSVIIILPQDPSDAEKKLIKAIVWRENNEIIRLIEKEKSPISRICSGIADNAAGIIQRGGIDSFA